MTTSGSKDPRRAFIHDLSTPLTTVSLLVESLLAEARRGTVAPGSLVLDLEAISKALKAIESLIARRRQELG
jgi:hypothetical protein